MRTDEIEELLWEVGRAAGEEEAGRSGASAVADEALRAYREGALPGGEAARLEASLAGDAALRARLAELAGVEPPPPPAALRRRLLDAGAGGARRGRGLAQRLALPLAASLALAVGGWWLAGRPQSASPLLGPDAYQVTVEGLAALRSSPGAGGPPSAASVPPETRAVLPETRVRVRVEPRAVAAAGVEIGLYRRRGDRLERLPVAGPVTRIESRGAAELTAPAAALVGPEPGERSFYVVAVAGALPPELRLAGAGEAGIEAALAGGGRRFVRAVRLRVLPAPPGPEGEG